MAEKLNEESPTMSASSSKADLPAAGNWWDSWISSAKTKSAEVYSMVKKDLDEIGTAVKSEASHVYNTTSTVLGKTLKLDEPESTANVMKKSFSSFMGQVSTVLNPEPDDDIDDTEVILSSGDTTMLSTYKKELEALQRVDATFIVPADSPEFAAWRESEASEAQVSAASAARRLARDPLLKTQYDRLVPDAVEHNDFWERYLFRVALLQDRLAAAARRAPLSEPSTDPVMAHLPLQSVTMPIETSPKKTLSPSDTEETPEVSEETNVGWDDEDFSNDVELTEEQQILLLEEYEKEIKSKTQTKTTKDLTNNNAKSNNTGSLKQTKDNITIDNKNKNGVLSKKAGKPDDCGNNIVEDYFGEKEQKDDASANSDESWEKEFEIDETQQKS